MSVEKPRSIDRRSSIEKISDSDAFDVLELAQDEKDERKGFWNRLFRPPKRDLEAIATQPSVFDDPKSLEAYRPPPSYENAHRFDPNARWTWREERVRIRPMLSFIIPYLPSN